MIKFGIKFSVLILISLIALTIWTIPQLPETGEFAIHWNAAGQPNGFADKTQFSFIMWGLVILTGMTAALFAGLPKIAPLKKNLMKSAKAYLVSWVFVLIINAFAMAIISWATLSGLKSGGPLSNIDLMMKPLFFTIALFFIILGNYLPKTRPNWFIGVRTPWSLSSATSWRRTHHFAGLLFMFMGLILAIVIWYVPMIVYTGIFMTSVTVITLVSVIVSYKYWRSAEDKTTPV